jgi:hypothetical protein
MDRAGHRAALTSWATTTSQPTAYPDGRALNQWRFSARVAFLTNGKVGSDGLRPHGDPPGRVPVPRAAGSLTKSCGGRGCVNPAAEPGVHGHRRPCGGAIVHTALAGDGQQQRRTSRNRREGR